MRNIADKLGKGFRGRTALDEVLAPHTSFCIGGRADLWAEPSDEADLELLAEVLAGEGIPYAVFGNGTNYLVKDGGFRGAAVSMRNFRRLSVSGDTVLAGAGTSLAAILRESARAGLSGFEFAAGIPASAGGAAAMNAGGKFGDIKSVLTCALLFSGGRLRRAAADELGLGYRKSGIKEENGFIIETEFRLSEGDPGSIKLKASEILQYRRNTQPLDSKSAGCIFKNPGSVSAGALISSAGLGGRRIGGAAVSTKHANYIINLGGARADDVLALIELVEEEVLRSYNVELEREVLIVGE